ncbi:putative cytochrome P450 [Hibiscus syriacus]|uniref:Cytochrome P450 n=1 Tax=Hibiscus syriacus TaxID=106335 RepID=A0A6A2YLG4_HIBSY|nr:putative cytochrome P450 [Hibiscus syriacus]
MKNRIPEPSVSLPLIGHLHLLSGKETVCKKLATMADKYGPLFSLKLGTRNPPSFGGGRHMGYNNSIFALAPYGEYWRNIRKMVTIELLSSHRLEKIKHIRFSEMDYYIKDLYGLSRSGAGNCAKVTISEALEQFTFNINLRMLVGKRFSGSTYAEVNSEPRRYEKAIKQAIYLFGIFVLADALPYLECMDIQGHTRDTIVKATTMILTLTGGESTSVTITWALSLLLNHPNVLKAAQEELDRQVGTERWVEESDIKNLKYLQAIVKETLRLYPPGPITGIREATQDCRIAGYDVSKGTRLIVNLWKLHRDPRNFEYMPFSSGRRSCPGITFRLQVVHLTAAKLIQGFEIRTIDGMAVDMEEGLGLALPKLNPLEVVLSPRLRSELYEGL